MQGTAALRHDLQAAESNYQALTPPSARAPIVSDTIRDIGDAIVNNGGSLPGDAYQALRSRLSAAARGSNDTQFSHALSDITEALDGAMSRSIRANNPADIGGFEQARRQWRNMLVVERAAAAAGENAAKGLISPAALAAAAKQVIGANGPALRADRLRPEQWHEHLTRPLIRVDDRLRRVAGAIVRSRLLRGVGGVEVGTVL
jgi:hypothetical protein